MQVSIVIHHKHRQQFNTSLSLTITEVSQDKLQKIQSAAKNFTNWCQKLINRHTKL